MTRTLHRPLTLLILALAPLPALARPLPVEPGAPGSPAPLAERCPLFRWLPADGDAQELRIFALPDDAPEAPLGSMAPALRVSLRSGVDTFQLPSRYALVPGRGYAWTVADQAPLRFEVAATAPPCDPGAAEPTAFSGASPEGPGTSGHESNDRAAFSLFSETSGGTQRGEFELWHADHFGVRVLATPYGGLISHLDATAGFVISTGMLLFGDDLVSVGTAKRLSVGHTGIATGNALYVERPVSGTATPDNHVARIHNDSTLGSADVLALQMEEEGSGVDSEIGAGNNFVTFFDMDGDSLGAIQGDANGGVTLAGPGNDYAEWLPRRDPGERIEAGAVVGIHGGRVALATAGADAVMVVSHGPLVAGGDPGEGERHLYERIAFVGQVDVPVHGTVARGDLVVPSGRGDGTAVAFAPDRLPLDRLDQVVGQAWQEKSEPALGPVRVAVGLVRPTAVAGVVDRIAERLERRFEARLAALTAELTTRIAELERSASRSLDATEERAAPAPR